MQLSKFKPPSQYGTRGLVPEACSNLRSLEAVHTLLIKLVQSQLPSASNRIEVELRWTDEKNYINLEPLAPIEASCHHSFGVRSLNTCECRNSFQQEQVLWKVFSFLASTAIRFSICSSSSTAARYWPTVSGTLSLKHRLKQIFATFSSWISSNFLYFCMGRWLKCSNKYVVGAMF